MALTQAEAKKLIQGMRFDDRQSWLPVRMLAAEPVAVGEARKLLTSTKAATRWAALEVYAGGGADSAPLEPLLKDSRSAVRIRAADALLDRGDPSGFAVLVDALADTSEIAGGRPVGPVWEHAALSLIRHTGLWRNGPPLDADEDQLSAAHARWQDWLKASTPKLKFDPKTGEWSVK